MKIARPLVLVVAALTLFISACSQPKDFTTPMLEPQYGTEHDDIGFDVVAASNKGIYLLSEETGYENFSSGDQSYELEYEALSLRLYDARGNFLSSTPIGESYCSQDHDDCSKNTLKPRGLYDDTNGFKYALFTVTVDDDGYSIYRLTKLNTSGNSFDYTLGTGGADPATNVIEAAVDANGNIYVAKVDYNTWTGAYTTVVAKYSVHDWGPTPDWQRASTVGTPDGITVSATGNVYVVGNKGLARYSNSGSLAWTKPGNYEDVIISGSSLYTRYRNEIRKFDGRGRQLWRRTQTGLNTMVSQDLDGDGSGNVYLSGKYRSSAGHMNAFARKLSASGSVLWTKTYGTSAYDDARGIATLSGSEIYVTGETQGSLAHPNRGGSHNRDGYVRKLNSSGSPLWTR